MNREREKEKEKKIEGDVKRDRYIIKNETGYKHTLPHTHTQREIREIKGGRKITKKGLEWQRASFSFTTLHDNQRKENYEFFFHCVYFLS